MNVTCTYCSASKDPGKGMIPAFKRYISQRIILVHEIAEKAGDHFFILSGEFGFVEWDQLLPYYDHLLTKAEVPKLAQLVQTQLSQKQIESVNYYTKPLTTDPNLSPYLNTIQSACDFSQINLNIFFLEDSGKPSPSSWKEITELAAEARQILIENREMGEMRFEKLKGLYTSDGMVYYQLGRAYEYIHKEKLALQNYELAKCLFPIERWQWEAQEAIDNLNRHNEIINEIKHKIDEFNNIKPDLRKQIISAVGLIYSNPSASATEFRNSLGMIVNSLLPNNIKGPKLSDKINLLRNSIPEIIVNHMYTIMLIGNKGAHAEKITSNDVLPSAMALVAILEWFTSKRKK